MKNLLLLVLMVCSQGLGDIWLSRGMKLFGEVSFQDFAAIASLLIYLFTSPWIWLGVGTLCLSLVFYLTAVSRFDLSFVLPVHAVNYVLNALLAGWLLGETVTPQRWLATVIITIGVFVVGWSEHLRLRKARKLPLPPEGYTLSPKQPKLPLWLFPLSFNLSKIWLGVGCLVLADSAGDLLLARGMKEIGSISLLPVSNLLRLGRKVLTSPYVIGGITCQAIAFFMFIALLSWADVSYIRPVTALCYVMSLLGAKFILHEHISRGRLLGISIIGMGVTIVAHT